MRQAPYAQGPLAPSSCLFGLGAGCEGKQNQKQRSESGLMAEALETVGPGPGTQRICITG